MKDTEKYLRYIIEYIERLENELGGISEAEFLADIDKQDSTLRRLEVIGETVKRLPSSFREKHPECPWKEIAGMRDVLIHAYFRVDLKLVWIITQKEVPKLKQDVERILK
ncbi:MAG TPA: DUF86 domain-containing protein [Candidatus Nanoarchaeia archaeon]|nr:DUF86 domain-containing protein [Candidatus Nanoarchaeia archaeon]